MSVSTVLAPEVPFPVGPYRVDTLRMADVPAIMAIERVSFTDPWPSGAYRDEVAANPRAHYFVVRAPAPDAHIVGFAGLWLFVDEGHVSTIAVHPDWRGHGLGELLVVALLMRAFALEAVLATLEVRVSNLVAQALYAKYGFEVVGRRKRYYSDNGEDALIMTVQPLDAAYRARVAEHRARLWARLAAPRD